MWIPPLFGKYKRKLTIYDLFSGHNDPLYFLLIVPGLGSVDMIPQDYENWNQDSLLYFIVQIYDGILCDGYCENTVETVNTT